MPASNTRLAAAAVVPLLALLGGASWQHVRAPSASHVEMLASVSEPVRAPPVPEKPTTAAAPSATGLISKAPAFDVVRVEPSGEALLAGRARPNASVTLVDRGQAVAEAKADADGNFVMTPPALKPGDYALTLRDGHGSAAVESKQSVVVSVPVSKAQQVVVAMAEPGKATTVLSAPPQTKEPAAQTPAAADAKPVAAQKLAIRSVEVENGSGLFASGVAPPDTDVRVYLNNSRVADVVAAAVGAWTVEVRKGLTPGRYAVRADALKPDRSVSARVEVPFEVPAQLEAETTATLSAPAPAVMANPGLLRPVNVAASPGRLSQADAVVDELKTELVSRGDNLWRISRKRLGHGTRYTEIYAANVAQIRNPKLVYPGQVFVLPHD